MAESGGRVPESEAWTVLLGVLTVGNLLTTPKTTTKKYSSTSRDHKGYRDGEHRMATSTFTQLLGSEEIGV